MSAETSDQEDEEVEEVMEADIVSLTLDPPPANAAAVLHQHHLHHHHGHSHGPNAIHGQNIADSNTSHVARKFQEAKKKDAQDDSERKILDNGGLTIQPESLVNSDIIPHTLHSHQRGPNLSAEQESASFSQPRKENDVSAYMPHLNTPAVNYTLSSVSHQPVKSAEVLPKKSSFSCLKSKSSDYSVGQTRSKKTVTFPEDENIVSMKVEPVNPWKDGNPI